MVQFRAFCIYLDIKIRLLYVVFSTLFFSLGKYAANVTHYYFLKTMELFKKEKYWCFTLVDCFEKFLLTNLKCLQNKY